MDKIIELLASLLSAFQEEPLLIISFLALITALYSIHLISKIGNWEFSSAYFTQIIAIGDQYQTYHYLLPCEFIWKRNKLFK